MPYYPNKEADLILLDMVNDLREQSYQPGQLNFGQPETTQFHNRNTRISIQPPSGVHFLLHYNRLDLQQLFGVLNLQIQDAEFETSHDLVPFLNSLYQDTQFTPEDFVLAPITSSAYPKSVTLIASPSSKILMGECSLAIIGNNPLNWILTQESQSLLTQENAPILIQE